MWEIETIWTSDSNWSGFHNIKAGTAVSAPQKIENVVVTYCEISSISLFLEQIYLDGSQATSHSMWFFYLGNVINLFMHAYAHYMYIHTSMYIITHHYKVYGWYLYFILELASIHQYSCLNFIYVLRSQIPVSYSKNLFLKTNWLLV